MNLLVLDIGSTSTKGSVYDETFTLLASHRVPTAPQFINDSCVEQNPITWKNAIYTILDAIHDKAVTYSAITVTSQRSSVFLVDANGIPLCSAIMWQDRRTRSICCDHSSDASFVYQKTGLPIKPIFGAPKMVWIKKNAPQLFAAAYKIVTIADYVLYLLTGDFVSDYTYGNRSLLMDLHKLRWDEELLRLFSIDEDKLCRLVPPGSRCGTIVPELAQRAALAPDTAVFTAGGDQQAAALGLGVFEAHTAEVTHGTGSFCILHSDTIVKDESAKLVCNVAAIPGAYILESTSITTGAVYDWFLKQFYSCTDYSVIDQEIAATPPLSNRVMV